MRADYRPGVALTGQNGLVWLLNPVLVWISILLVLDHFFVKIS
tara:strand:+ start:289 stop:417 length:129 start_codon:yes stop_codon:yes gene_type:complete